MVGGAVVADPGDELVEPVEDQDDPALAQQVAERAQVDGLLAVVGEVRGDQAVDGVGLVQRAELDVDGDEVRQLGREAPRDLVQREGLAAAEVAEQQQEAAVVLGDRAHQLVDDVGPHRLVEAAGDLPVPLRQEQPRRVAVVGLQPGGLRGHVVAQVEQALELGEAAHPDAAAHGLGA